MFKEGPAHVAQDVLSLSVDRNAKVAAQEGSSGRHSIDERMTTREVTDEGYSKWRESTVGAAGGMFNSTAKECLLVP